MKRLLFVPLALIAMAAGAATRVWQDQCGPFTDVSPLYCPYVLEAYYTGITAGTSATTFSPDLPITRAQSAVFTTKALNQALARGSRRAALGQWWTTTPYFTAGLGVTNVGTSPQAVVSDGSDIWVSDGDGSGSVYRVRGSDGQVLGVWTVTGNARALAVAMGRVFVASFDATFAGTLWSIDPTQPPGPAVPVAALNTAPVAIAFDGAHIWVADAGTPGPGAISGDLIMITPGPSVPWSGTVISPPCGGCQHPSPQALLFDGSAMWTLQGNQLEKFDTDGNFVSSVDLGQSGAAMVFDGWNIWVPVGGTSIQVVGAASGQIVATLTGNGLVGAGAPAFDGQRVLVTDTDSVSLFRAADLAPLGSFSTGAGTSPVAVCSDGINFWIALLGTGQLARF